MAKDRVEILQERVDAGRRRQWPRLFWGPGSRGRQLFLPLVVFLGMLDLTMTLWWLERAQEKRVFEEKLMLVRDQLASRLESLADLHLTSMRLLRTDWREGRLDTTAEFLAAAASVRKEVPVLKMLGNVRTGICVGMTPIEPMVDHADLRYDEFWGPLLEQGQKAGDCAAGPFFQEGASEVTVAMVMPWTRPRKEGPDEVGAVIGRLGVADLVAFLMDDETRRDFLIQLTEGTQRILQVGDGITGDSRTREPARVRVLDRTWQLHVRPSQRFYASQMSHSPVWILWCGLISSFLIAGTFHQTLQHQWREGEQTRSYLAALESLNALSAAISAKLGSAQLLDELAADAGKLLGMSAAAITLVDESRQGVVLVASDGVQIDGGGVSIPAG